MDREKVGITYDINLFSNFALYYLVEYLRNSGMAANGAIPRNFRASSLGYLPQTTRWAI
jgi:hypothetical protein